MRKTTITMMTSLLALVLIATVVNAEVKVKANSVQKAQEFMKAQMYDKAVPILNNLVNESPTNVEYHFLLAECYLNLNNTQAAENEFARVATMNSGQVRRISEVYKKIGYRRLNNKDYSSASYLLWKAASYSDDLKKSIRTAMFIKVREALDKDNISDAGAYLSIAERLGGQYNFDVYKSSDERFYLFLAAVAKDKGSFSGAKDIYQRIVKLTKNPETKQIAERDLILIGKLEKKLKVYNNITLLNQHNENQDDVYTIAFNNRGDILASSGYDKKIAVVDLKKNKLMTLLNAYDNYTDTVTTLLFDKDDTYLYSSSTTGPIKKWDIDKREFSNELPIKGRIYRMCLSHDKQFLVTGSSDGTITKYDLLSNKTIWQKEHIHSDGIDGIDISCDDEVIISGDRAGKILMTDSKTGAVIGSLSGHSNKVRFIRAHPKKMIVASGDTKGLLRIWDLTSRNVISSINHVGSVRGIAFHPDQPVIFSGDEKGFVKISNFQNGNLIKELKADKKCVYWVEVSPNAKLLATSGTKPDASVKFWNIDIDWNLLID